MDNSLGKVMYMLEDVFVTIMLPHSNGGTNI